MKNTPFWWEQAPRELAQELVQPAKIDVAIIGAGYTGLSAALVLARSGLSVAVFEAGQLGEGASSRNGGMLGPSFHKLGIAGLTRRYGRDRTHNIIRESISFVDFIEDFLNQENIEADFVRCGRFLGANNAAHYDAMARELEVLVQVCNVSGTMVPRGEQGEETGSARYHGGLVYHKDGGLHPGKFHNGLVSVVRRAGAVILPFTPVQNIQRLAGKFDITTPLGKVQAERVAICTNGYTGPQFSDFRRRILPIRSAMIATEPLSLDLMSTLMPKSRVYGDSRRIVVYYRPSPDGQRILFGSRATGLKDEPHQNAQNLFRSLVKTFPQLSGTKLSHVWSGLVGYSFSHAPHIGQLNGLDYAMGYCGSGVARATYFGKKLAHKILGESEEGRTSFDDLDFLTNPLYTGNPWFIPLIMNWNKMLDRWGL